MKESKGIVALGLLAVLASSVAVQAQQPPTLDSVTVTDTVGKYIKDAQKLAADAKTAAELETCSTHGRNGFVFSVTAERKEASGKVLSQCQASFMNKESEDQAACAANVVCVPAKAGNNCPAPTNPDKKPPTQCTGDKGVVVLDLFFNYTYYDKIRNSELFEMGKTGIGRCYSVDNHGYYGIILNGKQISQTTTNAYVAGIYLKNAIRDGSCDPELIMQGLWTTSNCSDCFFQITNIGEQFYGNMYPWRGDKSGSGGPQPIKVISQKVFVYRGDTFSVQIVDGVLKISNLTAPDSAYNIKSGVKLRR